MTPLASIVGDEGAGAGADVDVEVVDRAVDREQVEGAQGADLIDAAGEAAATEDQGGLRRAFAALPRRRGCVSISTTLPINMHYPTQ